MSKKFKHYRGYPFDFIGAIAAKVRTMPKIDWETFWRNRNDKVHKLLTESETIIIKGIWKYSQKSPDGEYDQWEVAHIYTRILIAAVRLGLDQTVREYAVNLAGYACENYSITVKQHSSFRNWIYDFLMSRLATTELIAEVKL